MTTDRIQVSRLALQAIEESLTTLFLSPEVKSVTLHAALAEHYDLPEECVVVGSGSTEIMNALMLAQAQRHKGSILASSPTFSLYNILAKMHGFSIRAVPLKDYAHDIEKLQACANEDKTNIIFLDNPHYITGTAVSARLISKLAGALPETIVVLDNVYGEYQHEDLSSFMRETIKEPNILIFRSFSKAHALLGLRVGYAIGTPSMVSGIQSKILPFSVNSVGQTAAEASLRDTANLQKNVLLNERAKLMTYTLLKKLGITYVETQSNTILINFGVSAQKITMLCAQYGIKCRDERKCGIAGHVQMHLIDPETIKPFLEMLSQHFLV